MIHAPLASPTDASEGAIEGAAPAVRAFGCPRCGGSLAIREAAPLVRCAYCGVSFLAQAPDGTFRLLTRARISSKEAESAVRALLRDPRAPTDLAASASRVSSELFYVPFWRFRATFVGRVRGLRDVVFRVPSRSYHGSEEGGAMTVKTHEVRVGTEEAIEEIQEIWRATVSACPLQDLGIPQLSSKRQMAGGLARLAAGAGELPDLVLAAGGEEPDGVRIDPMIPAAEARCEADRIFERFVHGRGAELREKELVYERLQNRESLVFYPVHRVRFQYHGRLFEATVDGLEGRIVRAVLPSGARAGEFLPLLLLAAAGGLLGGLILRAMVSPPTFLPELASLPLRSSFWLLSLAGGALWASALRALARRFLQEDEDVVLTP